MAARKKGRKTKSKKEVLVGTYTPPRIGTCIICGGSVQKKTDKRKRMYAKCHLCSSMMFLGSYQAEVGYNIVENLINQNLIGFQEAIRNEMIRIQGEKIKEQKEKLLEKELKELDKKLGIKDE